MVRFFRRGREVPHDRIASALGEPKTTPTESALKWRLRMMERREAAGFPDYQFPPSFKAPWRVETIAYEVDGFDADGFRKWKVKHKTFQTYFAAIDEVNHHIFEVEQRCRFSAGVRLYVVWNQSSGEVVDAWKGENGECDTVKKYKAECAARFGETEWLGSLQQ